MREGLKGARPHSLVALVLAGGASLAIVALAIGAALTEAGLGTGNLSAESSTLLSTALGAAIGAIATYLGGRSTEPAPPPAAPYDGTDAPTSEWPSDPAASR